MEITYWSLLSPHSVSLFNSKVTLIRSAYWTSHSFTQYIYQTTSFCQVPFCPSCIIQLWNSVTNTTPPQARKGPQMLIYSLLGKHPTDLYCLLTVWNWMVSSLFASSNAKKDLLWDMLAMSCHLKNSRKWQRECAQMCTRDTQPITVPEIWCISWYWLTIFETKQLFNQLARIS